MNKQVWLTIVLVAAVGIFGIHFIYMKTEGARADLTETGLYSLTEGTHDILDKMQAENVKPIDVKLYFSATAGKSLPKFIKNFITYESYVHNLLREYERYSDGKVRVETIDPVPDSDQADDAADYGLEGKPINQQGDLFYFGLAFVTQTGSQDRVEFLWPEQQENIEYEISKRLYNLIWPAQKRIGVLSSLEVMGIDNPYMMRMLQMQGKQPPEPWTALELLKEGYEVSSIAADTDAISKDEYDLVVVIHPKNLSDKTLWALNEWVVTGGSTLIFLDPYAIEDQPPQSPQMQQNPMAMLQYERASRLDKLLEAWGLTTKDNTFTVDYDLATKRPVQQGGAPQKVLIDLSIDESTIASTVNGDNPVFQGLTNLRLFTPGALYPVEGTDVDITPLMTTTQAGGTLTIMPGFVTDGLGYTDLSNPGKLISAYEPSDEKVGLAYMLSGTLPSAFPDGATFPAQQPEPPPGMPPGMQMPPDENAEMITKEPLAEDALAETRVMVFADTDFISDQLAFSRSLFGVQAVNDNHKVLLNAVDYMLGASELMKVRAKKKIRRPFELFDRIEAQADKDTLANEQAIRDQIEQFRQDLQEKQRGINEQNAALLQKKVQDDINRLNEKIRESERALREIRKQKRALLEGEETFVSFTMVWLMPILVSLGGLIAYFRRKSRAATVKGG